jgi:hypothetical protein
MLILLCAGRNYLKKNWGRLERGLRHDARTG